MENEPVHSRDHTVTPHTDLSPVLGATNPLEEATEPYGSGDSSRLHFRHKDKCLTLLPAIVIKRSIMVYRRQVVWNHSLCSERTTYSLEIDPDTPFLS